SNARSLPLDCRHSDSSLISRRQCYYSNVDRTRVEILLVEDNDADVRLFETLMNGAFHLTVSKTGAEAVDRLFQRGAFRGCPRPDIVVLDLNVPILNGHEVLNVIKWNSSLRSI